MKSLNVRSLHAKGRRVEVSFHFYVFEDKLIRRSVADADGLNITYSLHGAESSLRS